MSTRHRRSASQCWMASSSTQGRRERLSAANGLKQGHPALLAIAEMVHDIDVKEDRYRRPETAGLARMISGLCSQTPEDELRLARRGDNFWGVGRSVWGK